jgi:hypothetical protein
MKPPLYDSVHQMALDMVLASEAGDTKLKWSIYQDIKALCEHNEGTDQDHPLQWEALADFTSDDEVAMTLYERALSIALQLNLSEYAASALLAMAERNLDLGNIIIAITLAEKANSFALNTENLDLRRDVCEFLLQANAY